MKNKKIFTVGIVSLLIFIGIASYLWYLYFVDYENTLLKRNNKEATFVKSVELINNGGIDYINATNKDDDSIIPIYYFRVKNNANKQFSYTLYFENTEVNDGCSIDTTLSRDDLEYELKLDNEVIKKGDLDSIVSNILDINTIEPNTINDYSLKVKLKENVTDYVDKHFHYIVTIKETK